jgi:hypothetical protein
MKEKEELKKNFFLGICYRTDERLVEGCPVFARFSREMLIRLGVPAGPERVQSTSVGVSRNRKRFR